MVVGGCIIELSAQWSDGGHVVPLMEEEMSFLAKLIVQKRAVLLFREAPASPCALTCTHYTHSQTHIHTVKHTSGLSVKIMEFEVQQIEINAPTDTCTGSEPSDLSRSEFSLSHLQTDR